MGVEIKYPIYILEADKDSVYPKNLHYKISRSLDPHQTESIYILYTSNTWCLNHISRNYIIN